MRVFCDALGWAILLRVSLSNAYVAAWCVAFSLIAVSTQSHATDVASSELEESVRALQRSSDELRDEVVRLKDAITGLERTHAYDNNALSNAIHQNQNQVVRMNKTQQDRLNGLDQRLGRSKSSCSWHPITTHGNYLCPDNHFVSGICLTNRPSGCAGAPIGGGDNANVTAGGVYCCSLF
jgi:hypothetical protein